MPKKPNKKFQTYLSKYLIIAIPLVLISMQSMQISATASSGYVAGRILGLFLWPAVAALIWHKLQKRGSDKKQQ